MQQCYSRASQAQDCGLQMHTCTVDVPCRWLKQHRTSMVKHQRYQMNTTHCVTGLIRHAQSNEPALQLREYGLRLQTSPQYEQICTHKLTRERASGASALC